MTAPGAAPRAADAHGVLSLGATYAAFGDDVVATVGRCDVVRATGRDALSYLQSQCTQDLAGLVDGGSVESLLLSPQGKVEAYVRVVRLGGEEALVVVAPGCSEVVAARLQRFKLRVKVDLEQLSWPYVQLRGPRSREFAGEGRGGVVALEVSRAAAVGLDLLGPGARVPDGVRSGDPQAFAALRIESGEPWPGAEITERTIPQEIGVVERAVSFTKGCYPGQELVARIDARGGHVPRRLRGVVVEGGGRVDLPGELVLDGRVVGELTSVAWSPRVGAAVALAMVRRDVEPPASVTLRGRMAPADDPGSAGGPSSADGPAGASTEWPAQILDLPLAGGAPDRSPDLRGDER